mgnify:CR=1 FL=1
MNTYAAQIIFRISCEHVATEQYEEQWRLVYAHDEKTALEEVKQIAKTEECTFLDRHGRKVTWKLIAVKDMQPVSLENGAMLFSSVKEVTPIATPVWEVEN